MRRHVKVFVASPGDVKEERQAAYEIVTRLPYEPTLRGRISTEIVAWDGPYYDVPLLATVDPQRAVAMGMPLPSQCDFVVVVMWGRMGTPLPATYQKPDGATYLSGTEWEYLEAISAYEATGRPEVIAYRRAPAPVVNVDIATDSLDEIRHQYKLVDSFFNELRKNRRGYNEPFSSWLWAGFDLV